jgi:YVTN family beta-propeller protein
MPLARVVFLYGVALICWLEVALGQPSSRTLPRQVTDPGVVTTRQTITPAGVPSIFPSRVYGLTFGADSSELWVLTENRVYRLDWLANEIKGEWPLGGAPGLQGISYDASAKRALVTRTLSSQKGRKTELVAFGPEGEGNATALGLNLAGGAALAGDLALVPLTFNNEAALVRRGQVEKMPAGIAPFGVALDPAGKYAYVSNWGGRLPKPGDLTATTGSSPGADKVVVDARGVASTGTVTRLDLEARKATHQIATGLHPTALVLDAGNSRLYVANTNSDSVSVIDTRTQAIVRTINLNLFGDSRSAKARGVAPGALALSPDGATLYVACGGINAIAVIDTKSAQFRGAIPTAWYPSSLSLSADGKRIAVGSLLGIGSGWRDEPKKRYVHSYRGSVGVVDVPDSSQLAAYTRSVAENNRLTLGGTGMVSAAPRTTAKPLPVPERVGEPSLIDYVVMIIRENRTYDQVLGDLPKGNGDPSLVMFGRDVTPNTHRLAEQFVLLDNFYATGGNSADGHQWLTQANETSYALWPGYTGRSYPFDGSDPIAIAEGGFLWDAALSRGKTVRIYGEYAGLGDAKGATRTQLLEEWKRGADFTNRWQQTAPITSLNKILARNFPAYNLDVPDVARAQIFLKDLEAWNREGKMPNLIMMLLPDDHTYGTSPGRSTPSAMVADNDLALGQIVEGLTKSKFWPKMAILVVEDDAQNGVDHVDGHRTVALAISPYIRRGAVDSTFYSSQSLLKTTELMLGLPALSLFDMIANDLRLSFTTTPDFTPYTAVEPKKDLFALNPPLRALRGEARKAALASTRMRWSVPDAVPSDRLNRILWHTVRGWNTPFPGTRSGVFTPLTLDFDDDEREERDER